MNPQKKQRNFEIFKRVKFNKVEDITDKET